jgi:predicted ATPase with chaperone activity
VVRLDDGRRVAFNPREYEAIALQVARRIADLADGDPIRPVALAEAVQYSSRRVLGLGANLVH